VGRSIKKGPYVDPKLAKKVAKMARGPSRDPITTWARRCTIPPEFIGHVFMVHNGRMHLKVQVSEDMVGHKLGEFAPTRIFKGHTTKVAEKAAALAGAPGAPGAAGAAAPAAGSGGGAKPAGAAS